MMPNYYTLDDLHRLPSGTYVLEHPDFVLDGEHVAGWIRPFTSLEKLQQAAVAESEDAAVDLIAYRLIGTGWDSYIKPVAL